MNLHEYQAKQLFARYRIPVTRGEVAATPAQAGAAADRLGGKLWVVKAQVHAGGRGKAGLGKIILHGSCKAKGGQERAANIDNRHVVWYICIQ